MNVRKAISYAATAVALTFATSSALAEDKPAADKPMADKPMADKPMAIEKARVASINVTIESVDKATRKVKLKAPDGSIHEFKADDDVKLDEIKKGDKVKADLVQSIALSVTRPGEPVAEVKTEDVQRRMPDGIEVGSRVTATAEVLAVSPQQKSLTFKAPDGATETIDVASPEVQKRLKGIKAGDQVNLVYTEAIVATLKPAK